MKICPNINLKSQALGNEFYINRKIGSFIWNYLAFCSFLLGNPFKNLYSILISQSLFPEVHFTSDSLFPSLCVPPFEHFTFSVCLNSDISHFTCWVFCIIILYSDLLIPHVKELFCSAAVEVTETGRHSCPEKKNSLKAND